MANSLENKHIDHGVASVGGYTSLAIAIFSAISLAGVVWALFGPVRDNPGAILVTCLFGALGLAFSLLGVRWKVSGEYLKVSQWGIPKKMKISEISEFRAETGLRWKQGVGIRWLGPGEWAMVCGTDEVVTIVHHGKKFMFSTDDASAVQSAISEADQ